MVLESSHGPDAIEETQEVSPNSLWKAREVKALGSSTTVGEKEDAWARQQGCRLTIRDIEHLFASPDNAGGAIDRHIRHAAECAKEARENHECLTTSKS